MKLRHIIKGLILILSLVLAAYLLKTLNIGELFNKTWVEHLANEHSWHGTSIFILAGALFSSVGFPRQAVSFMAGYGFGLIYGSALALIAVTLGCMLAFIYARFLGRSMLPDSLKAKIGKLDHIMDSNPFMMALLVRFLPVGSNLVTNLAAGISSIRALPFFAGSSLGYIPQTIIFALIGSGVNIDPVLRISLGTLLFVISGILGFYMYRQYKKNLTDNDPAAHIIDDELEETP